MIYFVQAGEMGPIKIGYCGKLGSRLADLQCGCPEVLVLRGCRPGTLADEGALHRRFADIRYRGEWFRPEPPLIAYIATLAPPLTNRKPRAERPNARERHVAVGRAWDEVQAHHGMSDLGSHTWILVQHAIRTKMREFSMNVNSPAMIRKAKDIPLAAVSEYIVAFEGTRAYRVLTERLSPIVLKPRRVPFTATPYPLRSGGIAVQQ